jgi:hypothetical protein
VRLEFETGGRIRTDDGRKELGLEWTVFMNDVSFVLKDDDDDE